MAESRSEAAAPEKISATEIVRLARSDRAAARRRLATLSPEEQARVCGEVRPGARNEFLLLLDDPEKVVPKLPEAVLVQALCSAGLAEAAWLLEIATPEQRVACFDLDCWERYEPQLPKLQEWADALIEAGRSTLARALDDVDLELWILLVKREANMVIVGREDEPPPGYFTPDGVVYFGVPEEADIHRVREIVEAAWQHNQTAYWRLVYGLVYEPASNCEESALRWRTNRLQDLGFPDREQAMRVYRPLRPEAPSLERAPLHARAGGPVEAGSANADLPRQIQGSLVSKALGELPTARAGDLLGYVLGVANAIAVADDLPLADADSIPTALTKANAGIEAGLAALAARRGQSVGQVLDDVAPLDLFRVGVTLDPALR